jgi:hypothetical protein
LLRKIASDIGLTVAELLEHRRGEGRVRARTPNKRLQRPEGSAGASALDR